MRIPVHSRADAGKRNTHALMLLRQTERIFVTAPEKFRLPPRSPAPDRTRGMDNVPGGKAEARRYAGLACLASVEPAAGLQQFRPGRPVDGAIHSASSQKGAIGRVDDGVHTEFRDVAADHLNFHDVLSR